MLGTLYFEGTIVYESIREIIDPKDKYYQCYIIQFKASSITRSQENQDISNPETTKIGLEFTSGPLFTQYDCMSGCTFYYVDNILYKRMTCRDFCIKRNAGLKFIRNKKLCHVLGKVTNHSLLNDFDQMKTNSMALNAPRWPRMVI